MRRIGRRWGKGLLVHTEYLAAILGGALAEEGTRYFVVLHGENTNRHFWKSKRRQSVLRGIRGAEGVIAVGQGVVAHARELAGDDTEVTVIENGYDPAVDALRAQSRQGARSASWPETGGGLRVSCVGNLQAEKGQMTLLKALCSLHRDGVQVEAVVVGEGPERSKLIAASRAMGLSERVRFAGALPPDDAAEVIEASNVFVLPSRREALGIVYLNAMALGKPVVGVAGTGVSGLIENGVHGFLMADGTAEELAGVLRWFWQHPGKRAEMGQAAEDLVVPRYSWRSNAERLSVKMLGSA